MNHRFVQRWKTLFSCCLLLALLLSVADGRAVASSPDSPSLNEIASDGRTTTGSPATATLSEDTAATPSSPKLSNELVPTEASINDSVPDLNRNQVSLELPDDLFSSTANLALQLRNFIGDFITRTSVRIAQVVRFFQPLFGYHLMIDIPKEMDV